MKEYFGILSGAAAFLALGLSLILWNERRNPPMPPPIPFFHEFNPSQGELDEIDAYRKKIEAIREKYHGAILAVLTPDQRKTLEAKQAEALKEEQAREAEHAGGLFHRLGGPPPGFILLNMVVYRPVLELLASDLKLDAAQQEKVTAILEARRVEVLRLVDKEPLPSFFQHAPEPGPSLP